jgi:hypothetical protein
MGTATTVSARTIEQALSVYGRKIDRIYATRDRRDTAVEAVFVAARDRAETLLERAGVLREQAAQTLAVAERVAQGNPTRLIRAQQAQRTTMARVATLNARFAEAYAAAQKQRDLAIQDLEFSWFKAVDAARKAYEARTGRSPLEGIVKPPERSQAV